MIVKHINRITKLYKNYDKAIFVTFSTIVLKPNLTFGENQDTWLMAVIRDGWL